MPNIKSLSFFHFTFQLFPPTFIIHPKPLLFILFSLFLSSLHPKPCLHSFFNCTYSLLLSSVSIHTSPNRSVYHLFPHPSLCGWRCEYLPSPRWNDSLIMFLLAVKKARLYTLFSNICLILSPRIAQFNEIWNIKKEILLAQEHTMLKSTETSTSYIT